MVLNKLTPKPNSRPLVRYVKLLPVKPKNCNATLRINWNLYTPRCTKKNTHIHFNTSSNAGAPKQFQQLLWSPQTFYPHSRCLTWLCVCVRRSVSVPLSNNSCGSDDVMRWRSGGCVLDLGMFPLNKYSCGQQQIFIYINTHHGLSIQHYYLHYILKEFWVFNWFEIFVKLFIKNILNINYYFIYHP